WCGATGAARSIACGRAGRAAGRMVARLDQATPKQPGARNSTLDATDDDALARAMVWLPGVIPTAVVFDISAAPYRDGQSLAVGIRICRCGRMVIPMRS